MLVVEGPAQHWMKIADWENLKGSLELKPGEPPANLHDQAWTIARSLHRAILRAFPKPLFFFFS